MMALSASEGQRKENMVSKPLNNRRKRTAKGTIAGFAAKLAPVPDPEHRLAESNNSQPPQPAGALIPKKPCHSARLALLCTQNAISLGAKTQLGLCPPGRNRRSLQSFMRTRRRTKRPATALRIKTAGTDSSSLDSYYALEKMVGEEALVRAEDTEEDYLLSTNTFDIESDEEASSGDEDNLYDLDELLSGSPSLDDFKKYEGLKEPLFAPTGTEASAGNNSASAMNVMGSASSGKLPFNHRKIRYFDAATAPERALARQYLTEELRKSRKRDRIVLAKHLQRMQRRERRRQQAGSGKKVDPEASDEDSVDTKEEEILNSGVSRFESGMSAPMSAALLLESLSLNPVESVEGMAKCYDGIVSAGVALIDIDDSGSTSSSRDGKPKAGRSEVLAALAPLLISSLEQPSGELILQLATLRRLCGTARYQRRFVQRVVPYLIRPPHAAVWCLRHQNDMEPILAAAELIFDSANEIFSKGWYERGRQLLADSVRQKTLNHAAQQLRDLSQESTGFALSLHGHRRKLVKSGGDASGGALAEWEVIAVDLQIRVSISNILSKDWSKVTVPIKDAELAMRNRRPTPVSTDRHGRVRTDAPNKPVASPRSPGRPKTVKSVPSPNAKYSGPSATESMDAAFAPTFASDPPPLSPPPNRRAEDIKPATLQDAAISITKTPPRSPSSPLNTPGGAVGAIHSTGDSMRSPPATHSDPMLQPPPIATAAPLSPQSSIGNASATSEVHSYQRSSSNASVRSEGSSSSTQPAHYRMLTSSAAERKRTVAACRALRSQIQRFEEAFIQLHGRPPKGASERSPLATTYAQYREWKRAIRADAACRIQALFRGARTRWILLRADNNRLSRVVRTRAGRSSYNRAEPQMGPASRAANTLSNDLSIPIEIGSEPERGLALVPVAIGRARAGLGDNPVGEGYMNSHSPSHWASSVQPRRNSGDRDTFKGSSPTGFSGSPSGISTSGSVEFAQLTLSELQAQKRDLKQQLKQYDMNFARKHGRMPVKSEKEPIRHLYETYNALKNRITAMEQEGLHSKPSPMTPPHQVSIQQLSFQQSRAPSMQRTPSPPLSAASGASSGPESSEEEDNPGPSMVRPKGSGKDKSSKLAFSDLPSTPSGAPSQDLAALKAEKGKLHQMLRSYEKDFFKEHKRQVSSFADIKPVASQYRRYKEIKKAIAALQQQGEK